MNHLFARLYLVVLLISILPGGFIEAQRVRQTVPPDTSKAVAKRPIVAPDTSKGVATQAMVARQITHEDLLRIVDRRILMERHKITPQALTTFHEWVLLSIDAVTPASPKTGDMLTVQYTLTNFTREQATGVVTGSFQSHPLTTANGAAPEHIALSPGMSMTSELHMPRAAMEGAATVKLSYRDKETCRDVPGPFGVRKEVCTAAITTTASTDLTVIRDLAKVDDDGDRMPDVVEDELLARFRPFYRFSMSAGNDEDSRPADVVWYVQRSELYDHHTETADDQIFHQAQLASDPSLILTASTHGASNVASNPQQADYWLNIANPFRGGESDWTKIQNEATGLYGHVVPLRENSADPDAITGYKIEYWQFYAFNPVPGQIDCYNISNSHEADWEGVELVVEADQHTIRNVRHHVHSEDVVFDLKQGTAVNIGGGVLEYRGRDYRGLIDLNTPGPGGIGWAQNNLARFNCNEDGCTHPVVYIEHGGHASWPTEHWSWPGVLNHDGNSPHAYLVATPPNIGEIGKPRAGCLGCKLVVGYNGHWGACGDDPPSGPPMKSTWGKP